MRRKSVRGICNRGQRSRTALAAAAIAAVSTAGVARTQGGTTRTFTGSSNGATWNTSSNWSPAGVPGAGDTAILSNNFTTVFNDSYTAATAPAQFNLGSFAANGTLLNQATGTNYATAEYIGAFGFGTYTQTGGSNITPVPTTFNQLGNEGLTLGYAATDVGIYNLGVGSLASGIETIGYQGTGNSSSGAFRYGGTFIETAGFNSVDSLDMAVKPGSTGQYQMNNGNLYAGSPSGLPAFGINVGDSGTAVFIQTGGDVEVGAVGVPRDLTIGITSTSQGTYTLSGTSSTLEVYGNEYVGDTAAGIKSGSTYIQYGGTFTQANGSTQAIVGRMYVAAGAGSGIYTLASGANASSAGVYLGGVQGLGATGNGAAGVFSLQGGNFTSNGEFVVYNASGSLLNIGSGTLTASTLNLQGNPALLNWTGGSIVLTGTASGTTGVGTNNLGPNFNIGNGGTVSLVLTGGSVSLGTEILGNVGTGYVNQSGGTQTLGTLYLGYTAGSSISTYTLNGSGAVLNTYVEIVGTGTSGIFNQSAGVNIINSQFLVGGGGGTMGAAFFNLTGGTVQSNAPATVGGGLAGTFNQSGGTFNVGSGAAVQDLDIGFGYAGKYYMSAGTLNASGNLNLGNGSSTGLFNMSGGTVVVGNSTILNGSSASNLLNIAGGSFTTGTMNLNSTAGHLNWTGGTITLTGAGTGTNAFPPTFAVGTALNPETLVLTGGNVAFSTQLDLGHGGQGTFNQTGGSNTVGQLTIGTTPASSASYDLTAGTLLVTSSESIGATFNSGGGSGFFFQTGGTHSVSGPLVISGNTTTFAYYSLTGGSLIEGPATGTAFAAGETIGNSGSGVFEQSGGSHNVGNATVPQNLIIGGGPNGQGTYQFGSFTSTLDVAGNVYIGGTATAASGTGVFNLSTGSAFISRVVTIWDSGSTVLNLSGGNLSTGSITTTNGGRFNWSSGALQLNTGVSTLPSVAIPTFGQLGFNVSGTTQGTGYAYLSGTGTATITGTLVFAGSSFTPAIGTSFQLFNYPSGHITGNFTTIQNYPGDLWNVSALDTIGTITLVAAPPVITSVYNSGSGTFNWADNTRWSNTPNLAAYPNYTGYTDFNTSAVGTGVGSTTLKLTGTTGYVVNTLTLGNITLAGTAPDNVTVTGSEPELQVLGAFNASSSFNLTNGAILYLACPGSITAPNIGGGTNAAVILNTSAVLNHNDPGTTTFNQPSVTNYGTINVQQGALIITNSATNYGNYNVSAGARLATNGDFNSSVTATVFGEFDFAPTAGTVQLPLIDGPVYGRDFGGTLHVNTGGSVQVITLNGAPSGIVFDTGSHVSFGASSSLTTSGGAAVTFQDIDNLSIPTVNIGGPAAFAPLSLVIGTLNISSSNSSTARFEPLNTAAATTVTTLNQTGGTIETGQDDGLPVTPITTSIYNLSGGFANGQIIVNTAMNWTGGTIGGLYGDVIVTPTATLNVSGGGGLVAQNGHLQNLGGNVNSSIPVTVGGATGAATYNQPSGTTVVNSTFVVTNMSSATVSGGILSVNTLSSQPNSVFTVSGTGSVNVAGGALINGLAVFQSGTFTVQYGPLPAGEDPELYEAVVAGYNGGGANNGSGTITNSGAIASTPYMKLGISTGTTGTYNQTGGTTIIGTALCVGSDVNQSSGSGIGIVNITGGVTTTPSLLVGSTANGRGTVTVSGTGVLSLSGPASVLSGSSITVTNGGLLKIQPHGTAYNASSVAGLAVTGGTLDITNNAIDIPFQPGSNPAASLAAVVAMVATGYNNGTWTGTGITSSTAAADPTHIGTVAVILNNDGNGNPIYSPSLTNPPDPKKLGFFQGTDPGLNDVLVAYTMAGDANLDGKIDGSDYSLIDSGYSRHLTGFYNGDFNYDGVIDGSDYSILDDSFNNQGSPLGPTVPTATVTAQIVGPTAAAVPEPAGIAVLMAAASLVTRRRRGRPVG